MMHVARQDSPITRDAAVAAAGKLPGPFVVITEVEAVAVVSQTCDIVRECASRPFVKVSPIVHLAGQELANAVARRSPRYAAVPGYANDAFADLNHTTTLEKPVLAGLDRSTGCNSPSSKQQFAAAVARHGGRFAFPDDVDQALNRLALRITKRAGKNSPEGACVDRVLQIRASATPSWDDPSGYTISLVFILPHGELDAVPNDEVDVDLSTWCDGRDAVDIAKRLVEAPAARAADREFLWMTLAGIWAGLALPVGLVVAVVGSVETEDSYTLWQHESSEQLYFDNLTDSTGVDDD